ncbi:hypothetical protein ACIRST_10390 [Kitasatospora sp. NPDC101447]|uniref:hypothetical protein n=1 Tax=Kitasatospora sp. NPDC101447 TaxID=3364102 RepID=UPI00380C60BE
MHLLHQSGDTDSILPACYVDFRRGRTSVELGDIMVDYHEYTVEIYDANGALEHTLHIHDDHHQAHGFNTQGTLKNVQMLVSIAANALKIAPASIKGFRYAGKVIKRN